MSQPKTVLKSLAELGDAPIFPVTVPLSTRSTPKRMSVPYQEARVDLERLVLMHKGNLTAAMNSIGYSAQAHDGWIEGGSVPITAHLAMKWILHEASSEGPSLADILTSDELKWLTVVLVKNEKYDLVSKLAGLMARAK